MATDPSMPLSCVPLLLATSRALRQNYGSSPFYCRGSSGCLSAYECLLKRAHDVHVIGSATSGEEALTLIPQHAPDLVLLDLMLPGIHGLALSQLLPQLPILIVSSYERTLSTLRQSPAFVPNIKGYLYKPQIHTFFC
jgi:CheY-like chemotaxis protein